MTNNGDKNKLEKFYYLSQKSLSIKNINAWRFGEIKTLAISYYIGDLQTAETSTLGEVSNIPGNRRLMSRSHRMAR